MKNQFCHKMSSVSREDWMCNNADRFARFDNIRIIKLYELMQYTLLAIPFSWFGSSVVMIFMKKYAKDPDKYTVGQLAFTIIVSMFMIVVFAYYIPKLVVIFPPMFPYHDTGYIPSKKGEAMVGVATAFGMFFYGSLTYFGTIVNNISSRIFPFAWKLPNS